MKTSIAMDEIRKIRDENSLRHLSQTQEERRRELKESLDWFLYELGKPAQIIQTESSKSA